MYIYSYNYIYVDALLGAFSPAALSEQMCTHMSVHVCVCVYAHMPGLVFYGHGNCMNVGIHVSPLGPCGLGPYGPGPYGPPGPFT